MKSPVVLPVPFSSPSEVPELTRQAEVSPQPLWLALAFFRLALEVHPLSQAPVTAAVVTQSRGRYFIHAVSPLAQAQGVSVNMPVNAAYALCPQLKVFELDEAAQKKTLLRLADWAQQFTSKVNIQPPQSLLLEIRGSLKLFGGVEALRQRIHQQLTEQWRLSFNSAIAPTPGASLLLASAGCQVVVQYKDELRSVLGQLPVSSLPMSIKKKQQLRKTGVAVLRDLWRLPKDALARRFGPELIRYMDRTLGMIADPLEFHHATENFERYYEFPLPVSGTAQVFNVGCKMLEQLVLYLRQRDLCIHACNVHLHCGKLPAIRIKLGLRQPGRDYAHLSLLLEEHLNKIKLQAPVSGLTLSADRFVLFTPQGMSLFSMPGFEKTFLDSVSGNDKAHPGTDIDRLLEQLEIRLGRESVKTILNIDDHRPDHAWRFSTEIANQGERLKQDLIRRRPLFILSEPQRLQQKNNRPWLQGPIVLLKGPERIEAGWWSDRDICRDYYIGLDARKSQLWVFQELRPQFYWYLHGFFA